jgi:hypothetical protein
MEAILNKYEIDSKDEFFEGILTSIQVGAKQMAKDMFDELNNDALKQEFNQWVTSLLENFDVNDLDMFETMQFNNYIKSLSKKDALQILINTVEGDTTQLSEKLAVIAEVQDLQYTEIINY